VSDSEQVMTISDLARRFQQPVHRITYIVKSREIMPCGVAGSTRLFGSAAIEAVELELERLRVRDSAMPPPSASSARAVKARLAAGSR